MAWIGLLLIVALVGGAFAVAAVTVAGLGRIIGALTLLTAALICGFLFLAGFEYPGVTAHKVVTGSLSVLFLCGAILIARKRPAS